MKSHKPSNAALDRVFSGAIEARIIESKWVPIVKGSKPLRAEDSTLLSVGTAQDLAELRTCLTVGKSGFHCMCLGGPHVEVSGPEGRRARISLHHGQSIRWDPEWDSDAELVDGMRLVLWLAARGVQGPLKEVTAAAERSRKNAEDLARWQRAIPECLSPLGKKFLGEDGPGWVVFGNPASPDSQAPKEQSLVRRSLQVLQTRFPDPQEAIRALLGWFGEGAGPWNGYPVYESVTETLLANYDVGSILASVSGGVPTPAQLRGAARALCRRSADARAQLSSGLRDRLRSVLQDTPDNLDSFDVAFLGKPKKLSEDDQRKLARRALANEVREALTGEIEKVESRGFGAFGEQGVRRVAIWAEEDGSLRVIYYSRGENAGDSRLPTVAESVLAARNWLLKGTKFQ